MSQLYSQRCLASTEIQPAQVVSKTVPPNTADMLTGIYIGQIGDWK